MNSLLDRWNFYMKDFCSPQLFIDWGFYTMLAATLQRRVWLGSDQKKLYGNMFTILCGPPGVGKGMVLGELANIFRHKKLLKVPDLEDRKAMLHEEIGDVLRTTDEFGDMNNMLIPIAPNATTYEALCRTLAKASRHFYVDTGDFLPDGKSKKRVEQQSSILFLLEELGSLFRKHTEDIHTFCCETYDCKDPYIYRTKNQGTDNIRRPCVNILAGTTPDFLKRVFASSLLTEGFASRTVFAVAMKNRRRQYETPTFTQEQIDAYNSVVDHVAGLSKLQGLMKFSPEALEYNKYWFEQEYADTVPNPNPKLIPYYARINITHAKICMAMHVANIGYTPKQIPDIPLDIAQAGLNFLQTTEETMHLALATESKNPLSEATDSILKYIILNGKTKRKTLLVEFYDLMPDPQEDLGKILQFLTESGKIKASDEPNAFEPRKEIE